MRKTICTRDKDQLRAASVKGKDFEKTLGRQAGPAWQLTARLRHLNSTP